MTLGHSFSRQHWPLLGNLPCKKTNGCQQLFSVAHLHMESTKLNVAKLFVQKKNQIISYTSWSTRQFQRMIDFLKQWISSCFSLKMFFFFFFNYQTMSTPFLTVWKQFLATFQVWQKILNEDFSLLATIKKKTPNYTLNFSSCFSTSHFPMAYKIHFVM